MGVFSLRQDLALEDYNAYYLMTGAFLMHAHDLWEQCGIITCFRGIIRPFGGKMKAKN